MFLPLGQVANKAGQEALAAGVDLTDREFDRKGAAVLALPDDDPPDTDDPALPGGAVAREIAVMPVAVGAGHQHAHIVAFDLFDGIPEEPFRRGAEGPDDPLVVDDHHAVGDSREDRFEMGLASARLLGEPLALGHVTQGQKDGGVTPPGYDPGGDFNLK